MTNVWIDRPIRSQAEDEFGRSVYAVHAAQRIRAGHTWDDSVVYGLTGAWGSGKTSMIAMIVEEIRKDRQWRVARTTPWATGDVTGLLGDFFVSLSAALPADRAKQARDALGELAQLSAPAGHQNLRHRRQPTSNISADPNSIGMSYKRRKDAPFSTFPAVEFCDPASLPDRFLGIQRFPQ